MITQSGKQWFDAQEWKVFPFQQDTWDRYKQGYSGLVNAPTGSGKTYSILIPALENASSKKGIKIIWISPIRALAKEIKIAADRAAQAMGLEWRTEIRSGDTSTADRKKQISLPPDMLITTPESIHIMMCHKDYVKLFTSLEVVVADEWHELVGSKRGVMVELALSRFKSLNPTLRIWGISATIANLQQAMDILLGQDHTQKRVMIRSEIKKRIEVISIIPDEIDRLPWAGHLGLKLIDDILPIIDQSATTLIFTNTRGQCEIWYQKLLDHAPHLAGVIAMHHGSISRELRDWVEDALYDGKLKAVVCTSSLDLGVDFRPVETIIQIGSPKGVSRFMQRAGRSGHQPGALSKIYFLPTHALELVESAALREAVSEGKIEARIPYIRTFDVLTQYLMTLAVATGFDPEETYREVVSTFCFNSVTPDEWKELLDYLVYGTKSLQSYDEYQKLGFAGGLYRVANNKVATKHRLSIGTIVSDAMLAVKMVRGKRLGSIEEYFISLLNPGDAFWFAGQALELVRIKDMVVQVKPTRKKSSRIPSYLGGRLPLSSEMSDVLRRKIYQYKNQQIDDREIVAVAPLLALQSTRSAIPNKDQFLIEYFESKEGFHLVMYPFEGRNVHEGMAALIAKRISYMLPISFSIAMNDYGFELLSDQKVDLNQLITKDLFSTKNLAIDIQASINAVEMARRKFRDIATISGLVFTGYPNKKKRDRHLQASSQLIFDVFKDYEPDNLLFLQAYEELMTFQLEEARMRNALLRIQEQELLFSYPQKPSPFSFPILVDRLREKLSSERLKDRIQKMLLE